VKGCVLAVWIRVARFHAAAFCPVLFLPTYPPSPTTPNVFRSNLSPFLHCHPPVSRLHLSPSSMLVIVYCTISTYICTAYMCVMCSLLHSDRSRELILCRSQPTFGRSSCSGVNSWNTWLAWAYTVTVVEDWTATMKVLQHPNLIFPPKMASVCIPRGCGAYFPRSTIRPRAARFRSLPNSIDKSG
jgi:hypothetical protein